MADADDFDVEELRALLRGEAPPPAGAKTDRRPAVKKSPTPATKAKAVRGKVPGRPSAAKSPGGKKTGPAAKRGKR